MVGFTNNIQFSGAPFSDSSDQQATASANVNFTDSNNVLSAIGAASLDTGGGAFNYNGGFTVTRSTINGDLAYTFSTNDPSGNALSFSVGLEHVQSSVQLERRPAFIPRRRGKAIAGAGPTDAVLSSALWAGSPRPVTLTLQLAPKRRAWLPPKESAAADPHQRFASAA